MPQLVKYQKKFLTKSYEQTVEPASIVVGLSGPLKSVPLSGEFPPAFSLPALRSGGVKVWRRLILSLNSAWNVPDPQGQALGTSSCSLPSALSVILIFM